MKIIRIDNDHILMDSETRSGSIAHTLEKVDGAWTCSCEWTQEGGHADCKHRRRLREIERQQRFIREASETLRKN